MKKMKVILKLENGKQRESVAKVCYDIAKALIIASLLDGIVNTSKIITTDLKLFSMALLMVAAGLSVEESIGRNDNDQP